MPPKPLDPGKLLEQRTILLGELFLLAKNETQPPKVRVRAATMFLQNTARAVQDAREGPATPSADAHTRRRGSGA